MTTETLMTGTEAANTNAGATASQPAPAAAAAPAAAVQEGQQQQENQEQGADAAAAADAGNHGEQGKPVKAEGAPEAYEFKVPDGVAFDDAGLQAFGEFAKDADLPQDKAQALLEKLAPAMQQRAQAAIESTKAQWMESSRTDKEFGGDKLTENLAVAKKALDTFGSPELRTLLNESGLGNHPELIRAFYRAGKAISEDKVVNGAGGEAPIDPAKRLFPDHK